MGAITGASLAPGDAGVVGDPALFKYDVAARSMGGRVVGVPLRDGTHDLEAMAAAVTPRTRIIFLPNPNNPTGTMVGAEAVEHFLARLPDGVVTVFDEAYYEYIVRDDYPDTIRYVREGRDVIILRTFSKAHGLAGLRIGYGMAKRELTAALNVVRETFNTNAVAQAAAIAALGDEAPVGRSLERNELGMKILTAGLEARGLAFVPSGANFVLADFGTAIVPVFRGLLERGIIVRPMTPYGLPTMARVTVGREGENEAFLAALDEYRDQEERR